jgi:hypothetical protein
LEALQETLKNVSLVFEKPLVVASPEKMSNPSNDQGAKATTHSENVSSSPGKKPKPSNIKDTKATTHSEDVSPSKSKTLFEKFTTKLY